MVIIIGEFYACWSTMRLMILLPLFFLFGCTTTPANANSSAPVPHISCLQDKPRLDARSRELAVIVKADQDERENWQNKTSEEMIEVAKKDLIRRQRVGEIFGEGCLSKAEDYAAAALVYQHGDSPNHFLQTFIWSKRGVELGDAKQKNTMALGIDRYLVNIGQKQLFGSQATMPDFKPGTCWCLQKIESSFPEKIRKEYTTKTLNDYVVWLSELNKGKTCPQVECQTELKATPKGSIPGFW